MENNKAYRVVLRRIAAGCIDWPLAAVITGMSPLGSLKMGGPTALFPFLLGACLYFSLFECSPLQATPGKMLFGLRVSNSDGESISIWQASLVRILQYAFIAVLFNISPLIESLGFLLNWNFSWLTIFFVLLGLFGLGYGLNYRFLKLSLHTTRENERVVSKRVKNVTGSPDKTWSLQKVFTCDLRRDQFFAGSLALLFIMGCYLFQSFRGFVDNIVDNRPGVIKGPILYYSKNIPQDTVVNRDDLEIRELAKVRIPEDAVRSMDEAVGHICKYGTLAGEIVSRHDITPFKKQEQK